MGFIYKITNLTNDKTYIGKTNYTIAYRWNQHVSASFSDKNKLDYNYLLHKAIRKYGKDNFKIEKIEEIKDEKDLNERESYWIKYYKSCILEDDALGYNMTYGGEGASKINKEEVFKLWDDKLGSNEIAKQTNHHISSIKNLLKTYENYNKEEDLSRNRGKRVYQFNENGKLIASYPSVRQASYAIKVDGSIISKCCSHEKKSCGGFFWSYNEKEKFTPTKLKRWKQKKVIQKNLDNEIVAIYDSMSAAGKAMNKTSAKYIKQCCEGEREQMYGFKWEYEMVDKMAVAAAEGVKNG